jgi:hypothetical protein
MIKRVGSTEIRAKHRASCHCGAVVFELDLPEGIVDPRRCDCSICRRKWAIVASVPLSGIKIIKQGVAADSRAKQIHQVVRVVSPTDKRPARSSPAVYESR